LFIVAQGEGGGMIKGVLDVEVRALLDQQLRDLGMAAVAGEEQGCRAVGRLGVYIGALGEKSLDQDEIAFASRGQ
jgi:hypothetical protein